MPKSLRVTVNGKTQSLAAHCRDFDKPYKTAWYRINRDKWSIEQVLGLVLPPIRKKHKRKSIIDRIYEKTICDIKTQCWNWMGNLNNKGYGQINIDGQSQLVHRIIYQKLCGPIPENKPCVLHKCDNPKCCNHMHLYTGTQKDNVRDCKERFRLNRSFGEKHGQSKLTEKQVIEIRESKETQVVIAKRFNVSLSTVSNIKNRKIWKHL